MGTQSEAFILGKIHPASPKAKECRQSRWGSELHGMRLQTQIGHEWMRAFQSFLCFVRSDYCHYYVVLETDGSNTIVTEKLADGSALGSIGGARKHQNPFLFW